MEVMPSLLRSPNDPLPDGCYCKPGRCMAPVIMGRQMPCRDPEKAKGLKEDLKMGSDPQSYLAAMDEMAHRECRVTIDRLTQERGEWQQQLLGAEQRTRMMFEAKNYWLEKSAEWQARAEVAEALVEKLRAALGGRGRVDCGICAGTGKVLGTPEVEPGRRWEECPCRKELGL